MSRHVNPTDGGSEIPFRPVTHQQGFLSEEEFRQRRESTTSAELNKLNRERQRWKLVYRREHEYFWRQVATYTIYALCLIWGGILTWNLLYGKEGGGGSGGGVVYQQVARDQGPGTPCSLRYLSQDFGLEVGNITRNDERREIRFSVLFPRLEQTILSKATTKSTFLEELRRAIQSLIPSTVELGSQELKLFQHGNQVNAELIFPMETSLSTLERVRSSISTASLRLAFLRSEPLQQLVADIPGQLIPDGGYDPRVREKMREIERGLAGANREFIQAANGLINGISGSLQRTQQELAQDIAAQYSLEKDVAHYREQLQYLEMRLKEAERKLYEAERQLNMTTMEYERRSMELQEQNNMLQQREVVLLKQRDELQREAEVLRTEKVEMEETVRRFRSQVSLLEAQLAKAQEDAANIQEVVYSLEADIRALRQSRSQAETDLYQLRVALGDVLAAVDIIKTVPEIQASTTKELLARIKQIQYRVEELEKQSKSFEYQISTKTREVEEHRSSLEGSRRTITAKQQEIQDLQGKIKSADVRIGSLLTKIQESDSTIKGLENQNRRLRQELDSYSSEFTRITREMEEQTSLCANYKDLIVMLKGFAGKIATEYNIIVQEAENMPKEEKRTRFVTTETVTTNKRESSSSSTEQDDSSYKDYDFYKDTEL